MKKMLGIYLTRKNEDDYQKAVPLTEKIASITGEADFYRALGAMYHLGLGCQKDSEKAVENYIIAAEKGDLSAKNSLVNIYTDKDAPPQCRKKIHELGCRLAEAGDATGQCILGISFLDGIGCKADYEKAFYYFELSAAQKYAFGYYGLGICYEHGLGCEQDNLTAIEMYADAADGGVQQAFEKINSMDDVLKQELERGKKIAEKYIDSPDPEMHRMARELMDAEI
ncbi:MAG: sel1 repeat family protein [Ruminococcaceae bacterium]|nr:sel1 repeat family protein [Oscillospiraceae bacterium]